MFEVNIGLSGHTEVLSLAEVQSLTSFGFRLVTACGRIVTACALQDGERLTAVRQPQLRLVATGTAFGVWRPGGDVVTWGDPQSGGDNSAVAERLRNVQQVQATQQAFAAILGDGSVVAWGDPTCGGDCSEVQEQLRNVQRLWATGSAFAAILADGSVVTWGEACDGGDSSGVQEQLRDVQQLQATCYAFAAIWQYLCR